MWEIVNSRNMSLTIDGKQVECLVPFADMLNHKVPDQTYWYFDQDRDGGKGGFVLKAIEFIKKGEEVCTSYNMHYNTPEMFLGYGFVQNDPERHMTIVKSIIHPDDPLIEQKNLWLHGDKKSKAMMFKVYKDLNHKETKEFIGFSRFAVLDSEDFENLVEARKMAMKNYD